MKLTDFISERILFGFGIITGYFLLIFLGMYIAGENKDKLALVHDGIVLLGPLLGVMVNSIWKADRVDKLNADTAATLAAKTPDLSSASITSSTQVKTP